MLSHFSRRLQSTLVKSEVPADIAKVVTQGKKIVDLEDYIDNLLIKILDVAPILLKQDSPIMSKHHIMWKQICCKHFFAK